MTIIISPKVSLPLTCDLQRVPFFLATGAPYNCASNRNLDRSVAPLFMQAFASAIQAYAPSPNKIQDLRFNQRLTHRTK